MSKSSAAITHDVMATANRISGTAKRALPFGVSTCGNGIAQRATGDHDMVAGADLSASLSPSRITNTKASLLPLAVPLTTLSTSNALVVGQLAGAIAILSP
jgi:hypothetical protein